MKPWDTNRNRSPSTALFHNLFVYHMPPLSSRGAAYSPHPCAPHCITAAGTASINHPPTHTPFVPVSRHCVKRRRWELCCRDG